MKYLLAFCLIALVTFTPAHAGVIRKTCRILGTPLYVAGFCAAMVWDAAKQPYRGWKEYNRRPFVRL